jgi:hypothetical protein
MNTTRDSESHAQDAIDETVVGVPGTEEEARAHIAAIRAEKGADRPGTYVTDLEAALEL